MPTSIGQMNHQIVLQRDDGTSRTSLGGRANSWTSVATVWGRVAPLKGDERLAAGQLEETVTHRVHIRYYSGLTAKWRLLWGSTPLQIKAIINPDERRRFMIIDCVEGEAV